MADKVRVAAVQLLTGEDIAANVTKALKKLDECVEKKAQIAAFPEGCLFGYSCRAEYWEQMPSDAFVEAESRIGAAAKRHKIAVVIGSAHQENGRWYNALAIFDEEGR
jgi:predicted amidohydrolase